jgi:hypothetical protein
LDGRVKPGHDGKGDSGQLQFALGANRRFEASMARSRRFAIGRAKSFPPGQLGFVDAV